MVQNSHRIGKEKQSHFSGSRAFAASIRIAPSGAMMRLPGAATVRMIFPHGIDHGHTHDRKKSRYGNDLLKPPFDGQKQKRYAEQKHGFECVAYSMPLTVKQFEQMRRQSHNRTEYDTEHDGNGDVQKCHSPHVVPRIDVEERREQYDHNNSIKCGLVNGE